MLLVLNVDVSDDYFPALTLQITFGQFNSVSVRKLCFILLTDTW